MSYISLASNSADYIRDLNDERQEQPVKAGFVVTPDGDVFVQIPAENRWGFSLCSDEQSWEGGIGAAHSWELVDRDDPRVSDTSREELGWLLEDFTDPNEDPAVASV